MQHISYKKFGDFIYKIPGTFRKWAKGILPHFSCTIKVGNFHIRTNVLLDTGSPFTTISPKDYKRTRLKIGKSHQATCLLAGVKFSRVSIPKGVQYKFLNDKGKVITLYSDDTVFLVPIQKQNEKMVQSIPSILGIDFLKSNGLRFVTEPDSDIAYIEGDLEPSDD